MPRSPSKPADKGRRSAEQAGRRGEALAALFLQMKGYRIVGRRVKTPVGEIDLVVRRWAPSTGSASCGRRYTGWRATRPGRATRCAST
jgi:hypothetical protein